MTLEAVLLEEKTRIIIRGACGSHTTAIIFKVRLISVVIMLSDGSVSRQLYSVIIIIIIIQRPQLGLSASLSVCI